MTGSSDGQLTCQVCADPINSEVDDYIKVVCSNDQCIGGFGHVDCCKEYQIGLLYYSNTKGGQRKKGMIQQRPAIEMRMRPCWVDRKSDNRCEGRVVDAEYVKALLQVLKKEKRVAELAPAPVAKFKPRKKATAGPQPQTRGPAHGGVDAVGCKRDIEIKPLAARDNRLGTGASTKPASDGHNVNKAKNLTLCRYIQSAVGQCPLHDCPFAHSDEEIAKNEQIAREKAQLAKAVKASKKNSKLARGPTPDDLESLPEGAVELANGHRSVSMAGSEWEFAQDSFRATTHLSDGAADDGGGWMEVGRRTAHARPGSVLSAGSHTLSFDAGSPPRSAPLLEPTGPLLSFAATQELIRWKLNACTGRLTNLGVTWAVAEAAAKATGADDNAAGELIFSGTDQAFWGVKEVDVSTEVAQALALTELPLRADRRAVEAAVLEARGNMAEAIEALRQQMSRGTAAPLPLQADSLPPLHSLVGSSLHPTSLPGPASPAPSLAGSVARSIRSSAAPTAPSVHDEDAWAPKWDDEEPPPQAAAGAQAAAPPTMAPQSPPPPPPQHENMPPEFQLPGPQPQPVPKAPAVPDVVLGPNTPAQPPPAAAAATTSPPAGAPLLSLANGIGSHDGSGAGGSGPSSTGGGSGALIFAGDFARRRRCSVASPPASPTPEHLLAGMAALIVGAATKQQQPQQQQLVAPAAGVPPPKATGGPAAAAEPEEFDDLLDMLMT